MRTRITFDENGEHARMASAAYISVICSRTSSIIAGDIQQKGSLNGLSSVNLILCFTRLVCPKSVWPREKIFCYFANIPDVFSFYWSVSLDTVRSSSISERRWVSFSSFVYADCWFETAVPVLSSTGLQLRNTFTSWNSQRTHFGGLVSTFADVVNIRTGTLVVLPGLLSVITLGYTSILLEAVSVS